MKNISVIVFIAFAVIIFPQAVFAQIGAALSVNRESYLLYENIIARLLIRNLSGKALIFSEGANPDSPVGRADFIIEGPGGIKAERKNIDYNPLMGFVLPPGAEKEILVPVSKLYIIDKPGSYWIKAKITHSQLSSAYETPSANFTVYNGTVLWQKQLGVPKLYHKEGEPEPLPRTVKILSFYDKQNKYVAIMIEDDEKVFNVRRIGLDIGNVRPKIEIDMLSRTHILIQLSPSVYAYYVFDINCELVDKDVYVKTDTTPGFFLDPEEGTIMVLGGRKAIKDVDYIEGEGEIIIKEAM